MIESIYPSSEKSGLPPGSLVHIGEVIDTDISLSIIDYGKEKFESKKIDSIDEIIKHKNSQEMTWLIVEGLKNTETVERIGQVFGIHQLVLEDILNTNQRPKFEEYDDHLYIVLKCLLPAVDQFRVNYEQISLLVMNNFVVMFKEKQDTLFDPLQLRIKNSTGKFRGLGSDYLAYTILDYIVDQNFIILDSLDETVNSLEDRLLTDEPTKDMLRSIQRLKREIISIRRYVSPVRELLTEMLRSESYLINENTHIFLRDVSDHTLRVIESIESYRDVLTGLLDIYMSSASNKMNEIMKVLTVFTSIFIPLTFIAGIYGMNFEYMPELHWKWAYPLTWASFLVIPLILFFFFKRKKWL